MSTCTACRLEFTSFLEQKDHFRMDWHRYNLKRKVVELPPISEEQFELRMRKVREEKEAQAARDPKQKQRTRKDELKKAGVKSMLKCVPCNKLFTTRNAHENHLSSKKHIDNAKKIPDSADMVAIVDKPVQGVMLDAISAQDTDFGNPTELTAEELAEEIEEYKKHVPLEKEDCIFCSHHATDLNSSLTHMLKEHGFFIPDLDYLVDLEGLISYVAEKVKVGFYCLYCNGKGKSFRSYQDVQKHMTSLSHCKLRYEEEDLNELLEFYDFSMQYNTNKIASTDEEVQWETDSEASIDSDEDVTEENVSNHEAEEDTIEVSETGELVLASGRRLGRREFRRYYRQRFRPDETRASVLAAHKENLLLAYQSAGVDHRTGSTALSTAFVANFIKKRNNIAGGMSIVEAKRKNFWHEKNRSRLDNRSHKLQKNPNRRAMVTV
ncbi:cytoplasmic protein [Plasmopara halstedii]|uniref:Cytoplasmic protein n=1 Tax=Plasmopara halstedii TaxID=4781 RepID=A0A0P1B4C6_PLAHL|nr:cytoplasmic protein [Plasmopara halstedii]CEG49636.1 cytoplasmic protein [Plasmopara halstedii]|eukprot:XP_024586005.1 cytoplasmic protein [Plasmopara halstedii]